MGSEIYLIRGILLKLLNLSDHIVAWSHYTLDKASLSLLNKDVIFYIFNDLFSLDNDF